MLSEIYDSLKIALFYKNQNIQRSFKSQKLEKPHWNLIQEEIRFQILILTAASQARNKEKGEKDDCLSRDDDWDRIMDNQTRADKVKWAVGWPTIRSCA